MTNLTGTGAGKNFSTVYADNGLGVTLSRTVNGGTPNNYTYNAVGNITSASSSSQSFQYDQNSNITCNQSGQNLTYNSYNEVTDAYSTCGSTATLQDTFSYDSNGDRIQEMFPWNGQQVPKNYGYNSLGQMTYFSIFDTSTNYTYSGSGQLMYENQGSTVLAQMTYNEATSTPEIISNGTYYFIYGPNNQVFETIDSTTPTYLLLDNLGSALADFAQNGTISNLTFYNTFGDSTASSTAPPIGFDNAYYDSTSGLYYLLNRFYDPTTSQFLTIDPRTIDTGIPYSYAGMANPVSNGLITTSLYNQNQSQPYEFVNNNPIDGTDMSGLCPCNSRQLAMKGALIYGGSLMAATGTLGIGLESAELGMLFSGLLLTTGPLGLFIVGSASLSFIAFQMYDVYDQASHVYGVSKTCH